MDDDLVGESEGTDGHIAFRVSDGRVTLTRAAAGTGDGSSAAALPSEILLPLADDTVRLSFEAEPNRDAPTSAERTRALPYDNDRNPVGSFHATALRNNGAEAGAAYFTDVPVALDGNSQGMTDYFWPGCDLSFCAYACSNEAYAPTDFSFRLDGKDERQRTVCAGSFTYALPEADPAGEDDSPQDAAKQPDIVVAMKPDCKRTEYEDKYVDLLFHHALSAVVFKVGRIRDVVTLDRITIENVRTSGSCQMTSAYDDADEAHMGDKVDDVTFVWSGQSGNGTYAQALGGQKAATGDLFGQSEEYTFMMIPQELGDDARFSLTFTIRGDTDQPVTYTLTHTFKGLLMGSKDAEARPELMEWQPDMKYVFTINLPDEIDVDVTDQVEGVVKSDVSIKNTGLTPGYIRAAIVGYWVDSASGVIIAPWYGLDGQFTWGNEWGDFWQQGSDGFYYYKYLVNPNTVTARPLFEKYEVSDIIASMFPSRRLDLSIVAQIVEQDKVGEAGWQWPQGWPEANVAP